MHNMVEKTHDKQKNKRNRDREKKQRRGCENENGMEQSEQRVRECMSVLRVVYSWQI